MSNKSSVVQQIGEGALLLPDILNEALQANDRLKYYLTLLQEARFHAREPQHLTRSMRGDRDAAGVTDGSLDAGVATSRALPNGQMALSGAERIRSAIFADLTVMMRPLDVASGQAQLASASHSRMRALAEALSCWGNDTLPLADIDTLTAPGDDTRDTVHQLVMDLHRQLNALQATIALESLGGALTYGLLDSDKPLVLAFMAGVNETSALKLEHAGLGTTATRVGDHLSIQNDLGTTDAHVIVVNVSGLTATLVYTDVHQARAAFLRTLLKPWHVEWQSATPPAGAEYAMCQGRLTAQDDATLEQFLIHLGSRLVFLIDWNKARKALRRYLSRDNAVAVLEWAAAANVGHRAFLEAGHDALRVALERGTHPQLKYGIRLDELLGASAARTFFEALLRISTQALTTGRTRQLIADEVEAELVAQFESSSHSTLSRAVEHAGLMVAIADRVQRVLARAGAPACRAEAEHSAGVAKRWAALADDIVQQSRDSRLRASAEGLPYLLLEADAAADALEQAAFLLGLDPAVRAPDLAVAVTPLAEAVCEATREYVRCLALATDLTTRPDGPTVHDLLEAIDRLQQIGRDARSRERTAETLLLAACADFRQLHLFSRTAAVLGSSIDALGRCAAMVRDYALTGVVVSP